MNKSQLVKQLKNIGVITRGSFVLHSGTISDYYLDIKRAYGNPKILNLLVTLLYKKIPKRVTCVAASGYGGIPLASVISIKYKLPLALLRDTIKDHGTAAPVDGYVPSAKDVVAIIDDVFTTGASINDMAQSIRECGAKIAGAYVIVRRENSQSPIPLKYILIMRDLV